MAKYYGKIGYGIATEVAPGVWSPDAITEKTVYGDVIKNTKRNENSGNVNDNINVSMTISFVAEAFAIQNFHLIKYATYMGTLWKVNSVEVEHPRLILTLGGVYTQ